MYAMTRPNAAGTWSSRDPEQDFGGPDNRWWEGFASLIKPDSSSGRGSKYHRGRVPYLFKSMCVVSRLTRCRWSREVKRAEFRWETGEKKGSSAEDSASWLFPLSGRADHHRLSGMPIGTDGRIALHVALGIE